jgi:hypothetical protein
MGGIVRLKPGGSFKPIVLGPLAILIWPDAFRLGIDGHLYFPPSQINYFGGNSPTGTFEIQFPFHML